MKDYEKKVQEAVDFLKDKVENVEFAIVLGSGLGDLAKEIQNAQEIDYKDIPNFPQVGVEGHEGKLIIGELEGVKIIALKGRKHYYEVADQPFGILQVVFPVHVLASLGIKNYFVTNAAGGLNPAYKVGDIMIIKSHFSFIPNPLLGRKMDFQTIDQKEILRFQPMNNAYDEKLRELLASSDFKENVHEGVYVAVTGPTYETEAEAIALRDGIKADATGMSTVPEVIVAKNRGMNCVGFSCITNVIAKDGTNATNHEEVKAILGSEDVRNKLVSVVKNFFKLYKKQVL